MCIRDRSLSLRMKDGTRLPLQVDDRGMAAFILPNLGKGQAAILELDVTAPTKRYS